MIRMSIQEVKPVVRRFLTRKDAAEYLGVSPDWIKRQNLSGNLRFSKVNGLVFIDIKDLDRLIEKNFVYK